jgi:hypothetical protein
MSLLRLIIRVIVFGGLLTATACTIVKVVNNNSSMIEYVDSQLIPYRNAFVRESRKRDAAVDIDKLSMIFGDLDSSSGEIGNCMFKGDLPFIRIDRRWWLVASDLEREEVAFHELGHCILNRDHCSIQTSMMQPELIPGNKYGASREAFLNELFHPDPKCPYMD